ncbi:DUF4184 family protein [Streptomyces indicus]|uniref:DUF4184 family protein n=1 Tax=Streptomyces indicus TaxID=417292 RepID=A0A1G8Z5V2_9ACTN|nr:DUF4184 family protein [Streptomyces indicus]SDK10397.1 protein of unknown function [Streptomyces indicus]
MPFTLSHAAAVLPLVRRDGTGRGPLLPSVMIAGSFAPDLTYFAASALPGAMEFGTVTHSWPGVFTVDVAITALLVGAWLLLREPLVALLPRARQGRVLGLVRGRPWGERPVGSLLLACYVSAVLGAATHTVWDAFTHLDRWGMRVFPVLGEEIAGSPLYWYLQYGGSALALFAVGCFAVSALRRAADAGTSGVPAPTRRARIAAFAFMGGCVLLGAVHRTVRWWQQSGGPGAAWEIIPTLCFGAGAGLVPGLLGYAVAVRVRTRRAGRAIRPDAADPATGPEPARSAARPGPADPHRQEPTRPAAR